MYIIPDGKGIPKTTTKDLEGLVVNASSLKPRQEPIKKVSEKMQKKLGVYARKKKEYIKDHPICEFEGCQCKSKDIHHKKGKIGDLYTDETYFMAVCRDHHIWIERNPNEAKRLGYSLDRL